MKTIYIYVVTHGDKFSGPNPGMTPEGIKQVRALRRLLPTTPSGVNRSHLSARTIPVIHRDSDA